MLNIEHDICDFIFKSAIVLIGCSSKFGCNTVFHQPEHMGIFRIVALLNSTNHDY